MVFDRGPGPGSSPKVLIIGHRGAAGRRPENTLPSFAHALSMGVDAVELDVHRVQGELVVIHDDALERTTNGRGSVAASSLEQLRSLDAGAGAQVPLLREVFELVPPEVGINVELKGRGTGPLLAGFLAGFPLHRVLVSSFQHAELEDFHRARPDAPVAPLFGRWRSDAWKTAELLGAWSINLSVRITTAQRIAQAHARGHRVLTYTVNDIEIGRALAGAGVDGVFTDYPDRITATALADSAPA